MNPLGMCPNRHCNRPWHGLPHVSTTEIMTETGEMTFERTICPGSHLFDAAGNYQKGIEER